MGRMPDRSPNFPVPPKAKPSGAVSLTALSFRQRCRARAARESDSVDELGSAKGLGNYKYAIDLRAGHKGFAAPEQPDVQIAFGAIALQMIHRAGDIGMEVRATELL